MRADSWFAIGVVLSACGCGGRSRTEPKATRMIATVPPTPTQQEAEAIFASRCSVCHGPGGGNGLASVTLKPHPRDFWVASWQESVDDRHIDRAIQYGGAAIGISAAMPPNPDLTSKPDVVSALRAKVRSFVVR